MVEAGAKMITVHGRTRTQGFSGSADLDIIRQVRDAVPVDIPVVGNGDVVDIESYQRMREASGCDAVMIGRGAQGNPWLFYRLREVLANRPDPGQPSLLQRLEVFRRHTALMLELKAGPRVIHELRKACAWYGKGLPGSNVFRQTVWKTSTPEAVLEAGEAFFAHVMTHRSRSTESPSPSCAA
jgi:tRNA-dihydrouridine synthase